MSNRDHHCSKERQDCIASSNLPVIVSMPRQRPSLFRHRVPAQFLSQLIAARNKMPAQRKGKRAPVNVATIAYCATIRIAHPSMPAGYGHTETA
ncbi:hypothetical protein MNBD_ALPHA12-629 [hydrothermal vent metagenome]|uniref:Uncharacterized protein n=1 Tax=hydrothermal vent metagenome TaxID=652676 RepID=A0A3B0TAN4_9ZZZZ